MECVEGGRGLNNIVLDIFTPLSAILSAVVRFWNWLDTIILVPEFGDGFSLLQVMIAASAISIVLFLFFGYGGGDD